VELLTNTAKSVYQECPRKYLYMYEQGYKPVRDTEAQSFGKLMHGALELLFKREPSDKIIEWFASQKAEPFEYVKAVELFRGYLVQWMSKQIAVKAIEQEFRLPLLNPATASTSRTFELGGKIDAIVNDGEDAVMEHKTSSEDISKPDSNYWLKLQIDPQISGYFVAAEKIGYKPTKIIYDVIGKPGIKPLKATPVEDRKHKKDGTLYANQRETDETPEEYALRLRQNIAENPGRHFQRREIARLEEDLTEWMQDVWCVAKFIMESRNENFWPRRASQCFNYGKCAYFDVCAKLATLDDTNQFRKVENKNEELTEVTNGN